MIFYNFFHFLTILLFTVFIFFIIGFLIRSITCSSFNHENRGLFYTLLIGILFILIVYSFYKSSFRTSMLFILPSLLCFFYLNKVRLCKPKKIYVSINQDVKPYLIIVLLLFLYQFLSYFDVKDGSIKHLFVDNYTYANIASVLNQFGSENIDFSVNYFIPSAQSELVPYRYADLWISAFVMDVFSINNVASYYLVTIPLLLSLSCLFIYSIYAHVSQKKYFVTILSFLLLFVSIFFLPILNPWDKLKYLSETSVIGVFKQKISFSFIFILLFIYHWNANRENSILFLILIPILYVSFLPVWIVLLFYLFYSIPKSKLFYKNKFFKLFIVLILTILCYKMFYHFFGAKLFTDNQLSFKNNPIARRLPKELIDPNLKFNFKSFFVGLVSVSIPNIFFYIRNSVSHLVVGSFFYLPFFFLITNRIKENISILKFILLLLIIGLVFTIFGLGGVDSYQFYSNNLVFISAFLIVTFCTFKQHKFKVILFFIFIILFNFLPVFSFQSSVSEQNKLDCKFLKKTSKCLNKENNFIVCYLNKNDFDKTYYSWVSKNILLSINQFSSKKVFFTVGNQSVIDNSIFKGYFYNFSLYTKRLEIYKETEIEFTKSQKFKNFLFFPGVKIPNFLNDRKKKVLISEHGYKFIQIH